MIAYVFVVVLLIITSKKTLSGMNVFDLVVTVALGSILATTILSAGTSLPQGLFAIAVLAGIEVLEFRNQSDFNQLEGGIGASLLYLRTIR